MGSPPSELLPPLCRSFPWGEGLPPLWICAGVPVLLVIAVSVACAAFSQPAVEFAYQGIVGLLVGNEQKVSFSVVDLMTKLPTTSSHSASYIIIAFQIIIAVGVISVPAIWTVLCLFLWLWPLTRVSMARLLSWCEIGAGWGMLDVFVIMLVSSLLELDKYAKYMVGDLCNGINAALSTYHQLGVLLPGEAICFGVVPTLQPIACGLIAAGLVITPLNLFVMHAASEVLYRDAERKETVAHPKLGGERGWTITTLSVIPPDAAVGSSSRDAPLRL